MPRCGSKTISARLPAGLLLLLALTLGAAGAGQTAPAQAAIRTAASRCARDDLGAIWPTAVRMGVRKMMVPPGAVSLTVCGYNGAQAASSTPQDALVGAGISVTAAIVGKIVSGLDALKPTPDGARYSCPLDQGNRQLLTFGYRSGPAVVLTVATDGCEAISNNHVRRLGLGTPVLGQITQLAKPAALGWPTISGHIRVCGGPAPSGCRDGTYNGANRVTATDSTGITIASAQLHDGRFRFLVATPGAYTVRLKISSGSVDHVTSAVKVTLTDGHTSRVVFTVAVA